MGEPTVVWMNGQYVTLPPVRGTDGRENALPPYIQSEKLGGDEPAWVTRIKNEPAWLARIRNALLRGAPTISHTDAVRLLQEIDRSVGVTEVHDG